MGGAGSCARVGAVMRAERTASALATGSLGIAASRPHPSLGNAAGPIGFLAARVEFLADRDGGVLFNLALNIGPRVTAAQLERGVLGRAMP